MSNELLTGKDKLIAEMQAELDATRIAIHNIAPWLHDSMVNIAHCDDYTNACNTILKLDNSNEFGVLNKPKTT